jgi:hypothetical protein
MKKALPDDLVPSLPQDWQPALTQDNLVVARM